MFSHQDVLVDQAVFMKLFYLFLGTLSLLCTPCWIILCSHAVRCTVFCLSQGLPVDCRQGYSRLYTFHLPHSLSISISLIWWLDAFSHRQGFTCAQLSWQKHALHFLPGFWWLFSVRANNHPENHAKAYRHGRTGKTCKRRTHLIFYFLKWWFNVCKWMFIYFLFFL